MLQFLSLFSGIGAFEKALDRLGVDYNLVNYCEIDKYASKSYGAIHNVPESLNLGDITKVDTSKLPPIDVVSYGFPCQDISLSGKQKGLFNEDGTLTRSGLFFEALRIIEDTKPKVAIAENVKNLTGKKFKEQFDIVLESLEAAGYNNYWQVLNAKDYGVPQNRERVFIVSIRKDVDTGAFKFPKGFELKLRLKDLLESEVNEKFYLSEKMFKQAVISKPECAQVANLNHYKNDQMNRVYSPDGIAPSQLFRSGSGRETKILEQGLVIDDTQGFDGTRYYDNVSPSLRASRSGLKTIVNGDVCKTVRAGGRGSVDKHSWDMVECSNNSLRIRKLTPLECWRLMSFDDEDFYKAEKVNSNTQLYKQAGNSIVVDVLVYLFKEILEAVDMQRVENKIIVFECDDLIDLAALKEKEPDLYAELVADYPCESATYVFKNQTA